MLKGPCLITTGVIISLICIVFMASFGIIFKSTLNNLLVIDPDAAIFDTYSSPSVPVYLDFYFFNVGNPDEVQNSGATPILEEVGPYRYLEISEKFDFHWNDDGTVEYREKTTYVFQEDQSNGTEDDTITSLNPVMLIFAALEYDKSFIRLIWGAVEDSMDLFETHPVGEWLYGYELPEFTFTNTLNGTLYEIACELGYDIPLLEPNRFGYYIGSNGSDDGVYRVYTGENGMDNYLYIKEWNYDTQLHYWGENGKGKDPYCNMLNGTDGTQFPPWVEKGQTLSVFNTDLCRSISLNYSGEIVVKDKVDCYHFVLPPETLQSGVTNPDNLCYCILLPADNDGNPCLDDAMLNLSPCFNGAPIVLSTPHFYQGNESDVDNFIGLNPQQELHETYLDIEPKTGVVMRASKRIQMNLPLKQYGNLKTFRNVPEVIFPILWADENAVIPDDDVNTVHFLLEGLFTLVYVLLGFLLLVGIVLIIFGVYRNRKSQNLKTDKDSNININETY